MKHMQPYRTWCDLIGKDVGKCEADAQTTFGTPFVRQLPLLGLFQARNVHCDCELHCLCGCELHSLAI